MLSTTLKIKKGKSKVASEKRVELFLCYLESVYFDWKPALSLLFILVIF